MKRILAYGDSNTWGFDAESFTRFSEDIRWTGLLQKALEKDALILEEGLCGRTTAFDDETIAGANGLRALPAVRRLTVRLISRSSCWAPTTAKAFSARRLKR